MSKAGVEDDSSDCSSVSEDVSENCPDPWLNVDPDEPIEPAPEDLPRTKTGRAKTFNRFVFTWNNYPSDSKWKAALAGLGNDAQYLVVGKEKAPRTGTPHLQGYFRLKHGKTWSAVKKILPKCYIDVARANDFQNEAYCGKTDKNPYVLGTPMSPKPGKRNDLLSVRDAVRAGKNVRCMVDEELVCNYQQIRVAQTILPMYEPKRTPAKPLDVRWYFGSPGTGKTYAAYTEYPDAYMAMDNGKWWDGYDGEDVVIIDDFRSANYPLTYLLKLLQPYPMRVECKGSSRQLLATTFIITTPEPPSCYYRETRENMKQLYRRINQVRKYSGPGEYRICAPDCEDVPKRHYAENYDIHEHDIIDRGSPSPPPSRKVAIDKLMADSPPPLSTYSEISSFLA